MDCDHTRPFRNESELNYVLFDSQYSLLSECRRHMAKHTRPFACTEKACTVKPFGDKAGLLRHRREVHGTQGHVRLSQAYNCPNPTCKRNRRGFARRSNMIEHCRRVHEMCIDEDAESHEYRSPSISADSAQIELPIGDAKDEAQQSVVDRDRRPGDSNVAVLRRLRARLDEMQRQKENVIRNFDSQKNTAMQRFDSDITTLSNTLSLLKGCVTADQQQG